MTALCRISSGICIVGGGVDGIYCAMSHLINHVDGGLFLLRCCGSGAIVSVGVVGS